MANEKEEYYDSIARELELDIDADVDEVLRENSPGSRQILRRFNMNHEYIPLTFSDLTTPTPGTYGSLSFPLPLLKSG